MAETTTTPVTKKTGRRQLPEIKRVFATRKELDEAQKDAQSKGHDRDVRKFAVTCNGKTIFVLSYNPSYAAYMSWKDAGMTIEEIDPQTVSRTMTPEKMAAKLTSDTDGLAKLSDKDKKALIAALEASSKKK